MFGLAWIAPAVDMTVQAELPSASDFGLAALLVIYAFVGWESALVPAGRNPQSVARHSHCTVQCAGGCDLVLCN